MEQEQEERQFGEPEMAVLRTLIRDIAFAADEDLRNSGHPQNMFAPFRLLLRQMLEASIAYAAAHPEAVEAATLTEIQAFLGAGWLDQDGVAIAPDPDDLWCMLPRQDLDDEEGITMLADALDTAYKAGSGAPASHGSRFAR